MKKNIIALIIMVAMLTSAVLTGCGGTDTDTNETVAPTTVASTEGTEVATEDETVDSTEASTENETEAATEAETTSDKETDSTKVTTTSNKSSSSNNSSSSGSSTTTTNKSNSSNSSSSTTSSKNNSSSSNSSSSSSNKNNSSSSSSSNKNNNSSSSSSSSSSNSNSSSNTTVITDDTKLTHAQFCTYDNMQRICNYLNSYYQNQGMILDTSLNISNSGWFYVYQGGVDKTATRSYNEHLNRIHSGIDSDVVDGLFVWSGGSYSDFRFLFYTVQQSDGEYDIYFCYG